MAYTKEKAIALAMREEGKSYSEIREKIRVSKSTLSNWLEKYPLSRERMRLLRDNNPRRIERFRETMRKKRENRILQQKARAIHDIGTISKREAFIAGFFLFWGEGAKARKGEVSLANTDPLMIKFFIQWILLMGGEKEKLHFTLHLYKDMDIRKELNFWSTTLGFPLSAFYKPYIKKSTLGDVTYKNGYGHGTCNARYMSQDRNDYVRSGLEFIRKLYGTK